MKLKLQARYLWEVVEVGGAEFGGGEAVNEGRETGDLGFCSLYTPF